MQHIKKYKNMMFNIGRLFHINKKKTKYLFMNDLEVITLLCGLKNVTCPNPGYTSITWVDIEFISEKKTDSGSSKSCTNKLMQP